METVMRDAIATTLIRKALRLSGPSYSNSGNKRRDDLRLKRLNSELLDAVERGDASQVFRVLNHGASVNATCCPTGFTAVHIAALNGSTEILELLIKKGASVGRTDNYNRTALHVAAWAGHVECVDQLLATSREALSCKTGGEKMVCDVIDQERQDSRRHDHASLLRKIPSLEPGSSPLHAACQMANLSCIQSLIAAGADLSLADDCLMTPLDVVGEKLMNNKETDEDREGMKTVVRDRFPRCIKSLLDAGACVTTEIKTLGNFRATVMHTAVELESLGAIQLLAAAGYAILFWNKHGATPLHLAVSRRLEEPLKMLLQACRSEENPVVDLLDSALHTPLHRAVMTQWLAGVNVFLEAGADIEATTPTGETVLHLAAESGNAEILAELLKIPVSDPKDKRFTAVMTQWLDGADVYSKAGEDTEANTPSVETVLRMTAKLGSEEMLAKLLRKPDSEAKVPILNATNDKGETPLFCAVNGGNIDCVTMLVNAKADITIKMAYEFTVLHRAIENDKPEILDLLLQKDADKSHPLIEAMDTARLSGLTPLLLAAHKGCVECVRVLLKHGCNARSHVAESPQNMRKCTYETALHLAAAGGYTSVVRVLLEHDSSLVGEKDGKLQRPIHVASRMGHRECVKLLLAAGADLSAKCVDNKTERTAIDMIIHNIPRPVTFLEKSLDSCITINEHSVNDLNCVVTLDYNILFPEDDQANQLKILDSLSITGNQYGQSTLFLHPLIASFLYLKWQKLSGFFYALILLYLIYVFSFTMLCIMMYYYDDAGIAMPSGFDMVACRIVVVVVVAILSLLEVVHALQLPLLYVKDAESWLKVTSFVLSLYVSFVARPVDNAIWLRHLTTLAILLAWMQCLFLISRIPHFGYYILMFSRVTINVLEVLFTFLFLIIGFSLAFLIQFQAKSPFSSPWESLVKTFMMMTGEYEYTSLFATEADTSMLVARIIFVIFVIIAGISLMNLLIGMAVNDIAGLEVKGKISRQQKRAEFLSMLETVVFNDFILRVFPKSWVNKLNKYRRVPKSVQIRPGMPSQQVKKKFPRVMIESILLRISQSRKLVGDPTLSDVLKRLNALSYAVDVVTGARIRVSDHIDSTESMSHDVGAYDSQLEHLCGEIEGLKYAVHKLSQREAKGV